MDAFAGAIGVSDSRGKMSPVVGIYATPLGDPRFCAYFLRACAYSGYIESLAKGIRERSTSFDRQSLGNLPVPDLPVEEQRRIADFLDDQVGRIDALLTSRNSQSALIEEAFARVTNDASDELMADATDWRSLRSLLAYFQDGDWIESPYITDEGIRLIQTGNVGVGEFKGESERYVSQQTYDELQCKPVFPGDVLISRLSSPVGRACLAPDLGIPAICSVDVVIGRPRPQFMPEFIVEFLSSHRQLANNDTLARGSTMQRLSRSQVGSIRLPSVGPDAQARFVASIHAARSQRDQAQSQIRSMTVLLEERKRALITAAVTGELDVTTAKPIGMGKWVPNVGAGAEASAAAQASSIGGIG